MVLSFCLCRLQLCDQWKEIEIVLFFRKNSKSTVIFAKMLKKTATSEQSSQISLKMANFRISFYPFLLSVAVLFCRVYLLVVVVWCWLSVVGLSVVGRRMMMVECPVSLSVVVAAGPGCRVLVVGYWLSVVVAGSWVSGVGYRVLVVGCWLSRVGCRVLVVGCRVLVVGCCLSGVDCRVLVFGCWLLVVRCWLSGVGCRWL